MRSSYFLSSAWNSSSAGHGAERCRRRIRQDAGRAWQTASRPAQRRRGRVGWNSSSAGHRAAADQAEGMVRSTGMQLVSRPGSEAARHGRTGALEQGRHPGLARASQAAGKPAGAAKQVAGGQAVPQRCRRGRQAAAGRRMTGGQAGAGMAAAAPSPGESVPPSSLGSTLSLFLRSCGSQQRARPASMHTP